VQDGRIAPAWREQCWVIAGLSMAAALLNWATTGDHLASAITRGVWSVAGVDLALLTSAAIGAVTARHLQRRETVAESLEDPEDAAGDSTVAAAGVAHG
jgi:hypothetical protein